MLTKKSKTNNGTDSDTSDSGDDIVMSQVKKFQSRIEIKEEENRMIV